MRPSQARFVTACQQLLALGVVIAVLTPAASVVSLDVVREAPGGAGSGHQAPVAALTAYTREAHRSSVLPAEPVEAQVDEYPLTAATGRTARLSGTALQARTKVGSLGGEVLTSVPAPVHGYGAVGVTWDPADAGTGALTFSARTRTDGTWSEWLELPYDADHGPDPRSAEARHARPGTDVLLVGKVDEVQVRSRSAAGQPAGMRLAVVDPGHADTTVTEPAAIETDAEGVDPDPAASDGATTGTPDTAEPAAGTDGLLLSGATTQVTPRPVIYSRKQWGANERLRDRSSLHYYEVHAGFVHHTVNANDYTRREVPGILRSIYAYHTQSRGWSDIGYNYLVDKFGRIWEGRAGGVARPVVGAHTLGYNEYSFAMSAIGNFETVRPRDAMLQAYGTLFAWKLSLHGVDATSADQLVGGDHFRAINGHRDAAATACPGRHLYARLPKIREYAEAAQKDWSGRELGSDLVATRHPDLVVRRASDGRAFVLPTGGLLGFEKPRVTPGVWADANLVVGSPDLTGDRRGDLLVRNDRGRAVVRPGTSDGFGDGIKPTDAFEGRDLVTAVGDLDGDDHNDLVARNTETGRLNVYLGGGAGGFDRRGLDVDAHTYDALAGAGDLDGDGNVDLVARDGDGHLWLYAGTGTRELSKRVQVPGSWGRYDAITGIGDYSRDGRPDLLVQVRDQAGFVLPGRADGSYGHRLGPFARFAAGRALSGVGTVVGNRAPDVIGRRGDDLLTYAHNGHFDLGRPVPTNVDLSGSNAVISPGDWDRDGHGDMISRRRSDGTLLLRRGDGSGSFAAPTRLAEGFGSVRLLAGVGDMTGDGWPDLMGQPRGGAMRIYPGRGPNGLGASYVAHSAIDAGRQIGIGRWDKDGAPDTLTRSGDRLRVFLGNGPGGLTRPRALDLDLSGYDWVVGVSDLNLTGHADLLVRHRASGDLYAVRATPRGFQPRRFLGEGMEAYDLAG